MTRTLKLLAAALLGGAVMVVGTAGPASAAGESIGACLLEELEITEIAVVLIEGGDPADKFGKVLEKHPEYLDAAQDLADDYEGSEEERISDLEADAEDRYEGCLDAPNPLVPEINEVIWGGFGFVVVLAFLAWKGLPAVKKTMQERTDRIAADLKAAEDARAEAEAEKARYSASLADAKSEASRIIEEARQQADTMKSEAQTRLNDELAQARAAAQADIDAAKSQAMSELRGEVATIAIGAAEAVVGNSLDREAQTQLVEDYINRVRNGQG